MNAAEPDNQEDPGARGMPIFLDPIEGGVLYDLNTVEHDRVKREWVPGNNPAQRLWRAISALDDVADSLEHYNLARDPKKKRRRLRLMAVPLHSLCVAITDTINAIISDQQIHARLPNNGTKELNALKEKFIEWVPFDRKRKLGQLRNKTAAHLDEKTHPFDMNQISKDVRPTEMGEWLHCCLGVICDLVKLDAYMWTAISGSADILVMMCQEPLIAVMRCENGRVVELLNVFIRRTSPKKDIFDRICEACEVSQSLFEEHSDFRITGFFEDDPSKGWASMLRKK